MRLRSIGENLILKITREDADKIGMGISTICAIHCILTPFLVLSMPWMFQTLHEPIFHILLALAVVPLGLWAFLKGYKHHRNKWVMVIGSIGLAIVGGVALVPHEWLHDINEEGLMIFGSTCLILAHYINRKSCSCTRHHH